MGNRVLKLNIVYRKFSSVEFSASTIIQTTILLSMTSDENQILVSAIIFGIR